MRLRLATDADLPALAALMAASIARLQRGFLDPAQIVASHAVMGLDTTLVADGTYWLAEQAGTLVGCGGWSRRATLYGGDDGVVPRDAALLDPRRDAARIRAMYTHPDFARRGIGAAILARCEAEARAAGFARAELMATLAGEPLYRARGYEVMERTAAIVDRISVPLARMGRSLM